uniref:Uncharacterized protein n=1 Tax=Romanomermis culicivorax TaxID=13658 RepID=A0A915KIC9_ROMCU
MSGKKKSCDRNFSDFEVNFLLEHVDSWKDIIDSKKQFFVQYCYRLVYCFFIESVSQAKIDVAVVFEWISTSDQMKSNNLILSSNIFQEIKQTGSRTIRP